MFFVLLGVSGSTAGAQLHWLMLISYLTAARLGSGAIAGIIIMVIAVVGMVVSVCTAAVILVLRKNKVKYSNTSEPPSKPESNCKFNCVCA